LVVLRAKVALASKKGKKRFTELAMRSDVHANQIKRWKSLFQERVAGFFGEAKANG
jgi:transposase-like protein